MGSTSRIQHILAFLEELALQVPPDHRTDALIDGGEAIQGLGWILGSCKEALAIHDKLVSARSAEGPSAAGGQPQESGGGPMIDTNDALQMNAVRTVMLTQEDPTMTACNMRFALAVLARALGPPGDGPYVELSFDEARGMQMLIKEIDHGLDQLIHAVEKLPKRDAA